MHHARADKAQIDFFLGAVKGNGTDGVMRIAFGHIGIFNIRIGNHRLINRIEINHDFGKIFCIFIGAKRGFRTGANFANAFIGNINQALQHARGIIHTLINHDLNARFGNFQRTDKRLIIGNTN